MAFFVAKDFHLVLVYLYDYSGETGMFVKLMKNKHAFHPIKL